MSTPTSLQKLNKNFYTDAEHQSALLHLGRLALSNLAPAELMKEAAELILQVLPVDYSMLWQLLDDGKHFLLMAVAGGKEVSVSRVQIPVDPHSLKGFTLTSPYPVIVENLHTETRFKTSSLGLNFVSSGAGVLIGSMDRPYGAIEVFSSQVQSLTETDINFLQGVATLIGLVLQKIRTEENLVIENQLLRKELTRTQFMTPSGHLEWDRYEIKNRLIESREKERLHLAQDLHDIPIQDLYGLIYQLDELKDTVQEMDGGKILDEFKHTLYRVINSLRTICRELRPPSLSPFGLEVAIRDHVEKFCDQNPTVQVNLDLMPDKQFLSDSLRLSLFRIYQQAMHNVARHAEATEVHVRFQWDEEMIILEIEDNGKGFEVPQQWMELVKGDHFGLLGIAERVESIRGKLEIVSALGSGTLVRTLVPRY
jgi:signal transduction histidine kinase